MRYFALVLAAIGLPSLAVGQEFSAEALAFYEKDVLPILKTHCYKCHSDKPKGGLTLLNRGAILKGGDLGPAVSTTKPDDSTLLKAINYKDGLEMPPTGKLKPEQIDVLTKWVKAGVPMKDAGGPAVHAEPKGGVVTPESKNYWAYKKVQRPPVPTVKGQVANPIDAFVLAKLEAKGLQPVGPADRVALVRRLYYDLLGLPPTPDQVDAFLKDTSPNAYAKLVDQLLDSPHYGEKWGRAWLDVVRYGETNGYERDGPKPFVWRYRDYVIKSFNTDKPYDQFIREQLAGDEVPGYNPDAITATGFYRLGLWDDEPADPAQATFDEFDDIVATTSQTFLGMTMNCARCHDHKIDPIPQKDYYAMLAFFRDVRRYSNDRNVRSAANLTDIAPPEERVKYEEELNQRKKAIADLTKKIEEIENAAIKKMPAEDQRASEGVDRPQVVRKVPMFLDAEKKTEYAKLKKQRTELERKPDPSQVLALSVNNSVVRPPETKVLIRGNPHSPGATVVPTFPVVLGGESPVVPEPAKEARSSGRRTVLANWIASKDNPLTARVMVNRIWQNHFGRGIVASPNDFGKFGTGATHPELLDWLASEFVARGWKIKEMHRLILSSRTYQASAVASDSLLKQDPGNMLFGRFSMRRLTAEEMRDSILAVSGQLNLAVGGPSVYPKIPREVLAGQSRPGEGWPTTRGPEANRRSVYVHIKRSLQLPILAQYDQADPDTSCPVRYTTTVPTQALGTLNGEFANESAVAFASRLMKESNDLATQVRQAIRLTSGRTPDAAEIAKDVQFVTNLRTKYGLSSEASMKQYCLMAINLNEFAYVD